MEERLAPEPAVLAALLHDIGHVPAAAAKTDDHELRSAQRAGSVLGSRVDAGTRVAIAGAIEGRRFAKLARPRSSLGAVLDDADNLDALGLTGVARAFLWLGEDAHRAFLKRAGQCDMEELATRDLDIFRRHWNEKLRFLPSVMRTAAGSRLAHDRLLRLETFMRGLESELAELLRREIPNARGYR